MAMKRATAAMMRLMGSIWSWFAVRDTYGVDIAPGEDHLLVLAVAACIDAMAHPQD